jgi:hypothetical protein
MLVRDLDKSKIGPQPIRSTRISMVILLTYGAVPKTKTSVSGSFFGEFHHVVSCFLTLKQNVRMWFSIELLKNVMV